MTTYAVLEQIPLEVLPGDELTCGLTVRNTSDVVEAYQFELVGEAAQWTVVEPVELSVYPGTEQTATVRFQPPRSARLAPGELPFGVRVVPTEHPDEATTPEAVLVILPFTETTAEITPRTSAGRRWARHEVAVDNRGNVPIDAELAGADPDGQLKIRPRPIRLTVEPGSTEFVKIRVTHRRWVWQGAGITHPFQVHVAATPLVDPPIAAEVPIALDAASVQLAIIPKGLRRLALALLALILLAGIAWFTLLRPAVRSEAVQAVQQPLQEVAQQAKAADQKADVAQSKAADTEQAVKNGGGAAAPKPATSSSAAGKTTTSPVTVNLSTTTAASSTAKTDQITVKKKTTLVVTDLVLQNPQGDAGRVDVVVNGTPILTLSLANFRDLDYHFVSPIEVTAGKTFGMSTVCQTPGTPIVGATAGQCRVLMFATGTNRVTS